MARLIARSPFAGQLPVALGGITISEVVAGPVTSIAPFRGKEASAGAALQAIGLGWPEPGQMLVSGEGRLLWAGRSMALLIGAEAPAALAAEAALTDQTGAFAFVDLQGPGIEDALTRLVPVDLRLSAFAVNTTRRTLIGHMPGSVTRTAEDRIELAVTRSMADTLIHDLTRAIRVWSARP